MNDLDDDVEILATMVRGGKTVDQALKWMQARWLDAERAGLVRREYEMRCGRIRQLSEPTAFISGKIKPWYAGPSPEDKCWPALREYLLEEKRWSESAVNSIDVTTTKILSLCQPPLHTAFATRGLVVGYVQSGKTANYTSLIAKAADVGYRFFIVLAGIHNSLRNQTQARLQRELVDLSTDDLWASLTGPTADFGRGVGGNTNFFLAEHQNSRILCVVKKNAKVLRHLLAWLRKGSQNNLHSCPFMVIDDEADQAGLNTAKPNATRTVINELILQLLQLAPRCAYIGYTATPFANVLIDTREENLYPRDFIVALPRPAGYFGAEALFGRDKLPEDDDDFVNSPPELIRAVPEADQLCLKPATRDGREDFCASVPPSLATALDYFLLATAARHARGQAAHSSMLIHTTLYALPHESIAEAVGEYWKKLRRSVQSGQPKTLARLERLWQEETDQVPAEQWGRVPEAFNLIRGHLHTALDATVVVENGLSEMKLVYGKEPRVQIAVGGNTLSRGLTLDGLIVSYFIRSASAYDTLLQMGRWFGFRPGYEDLPRIWMSDELKGYFNDLATVEQEIRNDIMRYELEGLTPTEFGVRIRTHRTLSITSELKMQAAQTCSVSYAGTVTQTTLFKHRDRSWLQKSWDAAKILLEDLGDPADDDVGPGYFVWRNVKPELVLRFLRDYQIHERQKDLKSDALVDYIRGNSQDELSQWNVAVAHRQQFVESLGKRPLTPNIVVNLLNRARVARGPDGLANLGTIASQHYFWYDQPGHTKPKDQHYPTRRLPLLLLIPISQNSRPQRQTSNKRGETRGELDAVEDILGIALSFPGTKKDHTVSYVTTNLAAIPREDEDDYANYEEALDT